MHCWQHNSRHVRCSKVMTGPPLLGRWWCRGAFAPQANFHQIKSSAVTAKTGSEMEFSSKKIQVPLWGKNRAARSMRNRFSIR